MASKRMFNMKIVDSDAFLDMPLSAQCLYFHLNMRADDDGFIGNPKRIQRLIGTSEDDLKLLMAKNFVITFDNGVIVIKHWRMHNTLSSNRYKETTYIDEKSMLLLKRNGAYSLSEGSEIDDIKLIEMSKRQCRRTKDEQKTNTDIDIDIDIDKEKDIYCVAEVVNYLNKVCGTNYKSTSADTKKHIKARFNEGFTIDDFKKVINKKCIEWKNTEMQKYLRPSTLFGTKFESYLNQPEKEKSKDITPNYEANNNLRFDESEMDEYFKKMKG